MTTPKLTPTEIKDISEAAERAYSNQAADDLLDEALAEARRLRDLRDSRSQQSRTE